MKKRTCRHCEKIIPAEKRAGADFCDPTCRSRYWRERNSKSTDVSVKPNQKTQEEPLHNNALRDSLRGAEGDNTKSTVEAEQVATEYSVPELQEKPHIDVLIAQASIRKESLDKQQKTLAIEIEKCSRELDMLDGKVKSGSISKYILLSAELKAEKRQTIENQKLNLKLQYEAVMREWAGALLHLMELKERKPALPVTPITPAPEVGKRNAETLQEKKPVSVPASSGKVISSTELKAKTYHSLNFSGKWVDFIGKPSLIFHAVVHGKPGEGKSTFCLQWAHYLAENFGKVIYISAEEGFSKTLRDKLVNNNAESLGLSFADLRNVGEIKKEIQPNGYHFIFIDSLDTLKIDATTLKVLREHFKNSALVTISQSTKDGKMRGSQEIIHDSDVEIRVENGFAVTIKNRFKERGKKYSVFEEAVSKIEKTETPFEPPRNIV